MPAAFDPGCLLRVLDEHQVAYVLIGGLAGALHGSPAMTNDADIVPDPDDANLERLAAALRDLGARIRVVDDPDGIPFDPHPALLRTMHALNTTTRCGDLDLTFAPAALEDYGALERGSVTFEVAGVLVQVAALVDIIRSKEAAGRAKDHATLPVLRALRDEIEGGSDARA
jgi:hypothetical protein